MVDTNVLDGKLNKCEKKLKKYPFEPRLYITRGMLYFQLGQLHDSLKDFNKAEELNPQLTPYLWQRGLTYYYLAKYAKAARQFELSLSIHSQDIETTLWFFLCIAQLEGIVSAQESILNVKDDIRPYMHHIYQVFAGLYPVDSLTNINDDCDRYHGFYNHFYAGLYYEAQQNYAKSTPLIDRAINYQIDDYMWSVACTHQLLRVS